MMDDRTRERVRKLLALASNNPSIEEAAVAFARAQEIATAAGLDLDDLGSEQPPEPPRPIERMNTCILDASMRRLSAWKCTIADGVAKANGCGFYTGHGGGMYLYGQPSDMETACYMYHAIVSQIDSMANDAVRAYKDDPGKDPRWDESPRVYARSWRIGCAHAVVQRLPSPAAVVAKARQSIGAVAMLASRAAGGSTALVRIDAAQDRIDAIRTERERYGKTVLGLKSRGGSFAGPRSNTGYSDGRSAGARVSLGNTRALRGGK